MKQKINPPNGREKAVPPTKSLLFSETPNQTKLFLDYQNDPLSLKKYYPSAVESHTQISERIPEVLVNYKIDRRRLCDVLENFNRRIGASEETVRNLNSLREDDCVAIVSGQQAGLFTGPLYTIYKALSAVKLAECLRARGFRAVPVFWIATEDHDFDEVSKIEVIGSKGETIKLTDEPRREHENLSVGCVDFDDSIGETIETLFAELPHTEFTGEIKKIITGSAFSGANYGDAFARMLAEITAKYGLICVDPLDERLKKLVAPVYVEAIKKSGEIVSALMTRDEQLKKDGYHAQILIAPDYFPLFWQTENNTRHAIKKAAADEDRYVVKGVEKEFNLGELASIAESEPQRFSPSVVLRAVVQDYLLPTVCYFGGAAEVAYFAQSSEVYRILKRPATTVIHRQSFTVVESKHAKTLERYDLQLKDLFAGIEKASARVVEKYLNRETAESFARAEEKIQDELNLLGESLKNFDPTLADNLESRRRKIIYHVESLRRKFHREQMRREETVARRLQSAFTALLPHGQLQERSLNVATFVNLYGVGFVDWIYEAIDFDDKEHRIVYL